MAKAKAKQGFKRKRSKTALPVWAAAGVSLAITGGASANAPATDMPSQDSGKRLLLAEEEVFDVSLGTFYVFDKEREFSPGVRLAGGRCGGCGGCGAQRWLRRLPYRRGLRLCSSWLQRLRWLRLRRGRGPVARRFARRLRRLRWLRWRLRNLLGMEPGFGPLDQPLLLTGIIPNGAPFQPPIPPGIDVGERLSVGVGG